MEATPTLSPSRHQKNWEALGEEDPLWAILNQPERRGGRWSEDEFFATGREVVERILARAASLDYPKRRERALDFGCGVGRLTQALAPQFAEVSGTDISASMLGHAVRFNRHGERCRYIHNPARDLRVFTDGSFDLVLSLITLQHNEPRTAMAYVREFIRVLRPGGLAVFQLPGGPAVTPKGTLIRVLPRRFWKMYWRLRYRNPIEMHWVPRSQIESCIREEGGRVLEVDPDGSAGPDFVSYLYFATRGSEGEAR